MQINNCTSNVNFQAKIGKSTQRIILAEAKLIGEGAFMAAKERIAKLAQWGNPESMIVAENIVSSPALKLISPNISTKYRSTFKPAENLFQSFMRINEKSLLNAEYDITCQASQSKVELMLKALKNRTLLKTLTGKNKPSMEEVSLQINKLSDTEVGNLLKLEI